MALLDKLFRKSPFGLLVEHTKKVHECVTQIRTLADALLEEDFERIKVLHHEISGTEHEADQIKDDIRKAISRAYLLSVGRDELTQFLAFQDEVADSAEDFAVVLLLRKTRIHPELKDDFNAFVDQVIAVSEHLLSVAEEMTLLAETSFAGKEAERVLEALDRIGEEEWEADKLQRKFALHYYQMEEQLDPVTILFYDKYCHTLSRIANSAEKTGKYLRQIIGVK